MGEERYLRNANRGERPKMTEEEIGKLQNCDRHLAKSEWQEMGIDAQRVAFEVMGFLKAENATESKTVTIIVAQEDSAGPKHPPQAPWNFRKYPEDKTQEPWGLAGPTSGSGNHPVHSERKGKDPKCKSDP